LQRVVSWLPSGDLQGGEFGALIVSGCARESMIACPWKRKR